VTFSDLSDPAVDRDILNQVNYLSHRNGCVTWCFHSKGYLVAMLESERAFWSICFSSAHFCSIMLMYSLVSWVLICFSMYTNFELTYANISKLLTKIFDLILNIRPCCVSRMKSLGYSVWVIMYLHKLNSTVFASAKIVSSIITAKTVIVWLLLDVNLIAVPSYKTSYRSNWHLF